MLTKKDIAEGIEEGINRVITSIMESTLKVLFVTFGAIVCIFFLWGVIGALYSVNQCGKWTCPQEMVASEPIKCNYPKLDCYIYEKNESFIGSKDYLTMKTNLCGYQESNAWFEQLKQQGLFENQTVHMECR